MNLSVNLLIIIITAIVSFIGFSNSNLIDRLIFTPPQVAENKQWYRFFSCGLIHADFGHLLFNMLSLYFFGGNVEGSFAEIFGGDSGRLVYLALYISALAASLMPTYFKHKHDYYYRSLGASGAVSAVIFAGLMIAPETEVYMFFIPIPIPGFIFAPVYLLLSAYLQKRGSGNINHSAHIWGALYGLAFTIVAGTAAGVNVLILAVQRIQLYVETKG